MVFFLKKRLYLLRVTVVSKGISSSEDRVIEKTLQRDGARIGECLITSTKHTPVYYSSE